MRSRKDSADFEMAQEKDAPDMDLRPKATRFRFKSETSKPSRPAQHRSHRRDGNDTHQDPEDDRGRGGSPRHHGHARHRNRRRRSRSPSVHPRAERQPTPNVLHDSSELDPDVAFRESLFDAMADDEGAAYWEAIYGQPVHMYAADRERPNSATGELERMTDDEYAAYVRQRMWEKTNAGILEEKARRAAKREESERRERQDARMRAEVERSLRQGAERRKRRQWRDRWDQYLDEWAAWDGSAHKLPWPTENRDRSEIGEKQVRAFLTRGLDLEDLGEKAFAASLKDERVRWHPDKIQQKLGGKVDKTLMRDVTAVFQIIDSLWAHVRPRVQ